MDIYDGAAWTEWISTPRPITLKSARLFEWFDMRDLAQVAGHIHDGRDVEILKDRTAAPRMARH
jgi:hypothetical protein